MDFFFFLFHFIIMTNPGCGKRWDLIMPDFMHKFVDWGVGGSILFLLWITNQKLKASKEGRVFDIYYPVFLSTLHEQILYPYIFLNKRIVTHCSLFSSIYVMNFKTKIHGKKINWVLTEFQMFPDHNRSAEADSLS